MSILASNSNWKSSLQYTASGFETVCHMKLMKELQTTQDDKHSFIFSITKARISPKIFNQVPHTLPCNSNHFSSLSS